MPDFSQPDMFGNQVLLSSFRGKYVLIDFWASWCHPCRAENPNLWKAYQQCKDRNFTILSISIDKDKAAWTTAVHEDGLPWKQVSDLKGTANEAARLFGVVAVPTNYLIDPNGKIVAVNLRGDALEAKLKEML